MIDFKAKIAESLDSIIEEMNYDEILNLVEYPKNKEMGDFAFPCFKLAKVFRKAPNMIAEELAGSFEDNKYFDKVTAVSGFLNFTVSASIFAESVIDTIISEGDDYGKSNLGEGKKTIVEYSSVNIAKPFHMGHIRSTMIGESLHRIYKYLGYDTVAINHLGDYGTQFGKLIVAYKLWGDKATIEADPIKELLKIYIKFHEEAEKNPALEDEARGWFTKLENGDPEAYELWTWFREVSLVEFNRVYGKLGVTFDSYAGESFYSDKMPAILAELREKEVMKKDDGAEIVDLEDYNMPPALITKRDGSTLYITRDLAAAKYRKDHYDFYKNIYVVGNQQQLHFKQWMKIIDLMGYDWAKDCEHVQFGLVSLEEGSLSTRNGRVVFLEEVLDQAVEKTLEIIEDKNPNLENKEAVAKSVGIGAVVFNELSTSRMKDYTFSLSKTLSFEGETGPYVQYAHARACSLLRKANVDYKNEIHYDLLSDDVSKDVVRLLSKFQDSIILAQRNNEPHIIARYVLDLAQNFNRFYTANKIEVEDIELKKARLALVYACEQTLKNGLSLVCLDAPEKM